MNKWYYNLFYVGTLSDTPTRLFSQVLIQVINIAKWMQIKSGFISMPYIFKNHTIVL